MLKRMNMTDPAVSIITTAYNQAKFLPTCIKSVQAQTFQDYEHIIIDDGSLDDTEDVVNRFVDNKIVYVKRPHVGLDGLSQNYNYALKLARGRYIAILEGDDFYPKRKLELQLKSMIGAGAVLSFGQVVCVDEHHIFLGVSPNVTEFDGVRDWLTPLVVYDYITAVTVMLEKKALLEIGGFKQPEGAKCVDYFTFLELSLIGGFMFVPEVLGYWVKHGSNLSDANLIPNVNLKYQVAFCKKHNLPIPWREYSLQKGKDLFHIGRHQLLTGKKQKAISSFKQAFLLSPFSGKMKAACGLVSAMLNKNLEGAAGRLNRPMERANCV
jgi:glycosyltransferase involved in cell wall biosynthesis